MDYGLLSLLPPLVAIVLAIVFRQVLAPLLIAIVIGAGILSWYQPGSLYWPVSTLVSSGRFIWESVTSFDHLRALCFSLTFGALVGVLEAGGGMVSLANRLAQRVRSRRAAQSLIAGLGLSIFFDDYANTLLVGGTMRSTADRYGISRAKLAYLVDTTSAPVAGLSPISTWVVTEISYIAIGLQAFALSDVSAFALLLASLPFRFYPIFALVFMLAIAISDRDFGPMRYVSGHPVDQATKPSTGSTPVAATVDSSLGLVWAAVLPIVVSVFTVLGSLLVSGWAGDGKTHTHWLRSLGVKISSGDSYAALIHGGVAGLLLALLLHRWLGKTSWNTLLSGIKHGMLQMIPAMLILWLAWALAAQTDDKHLNTGGYIAALLDDRVPALWLPTAVFVIASAVAFSTGTSWGTMAILVPIALRLGLDSAGGDPYHPISLATLGSVLAGAIFGDHCSPISDTTVLSSRASGCDHHAHVRTQAPYAFVVAMIAILVGSLPVALGVSSYACLAVGCITCIAVVMIFGHKPTKQEQNIDPSTPVAAPENTGSG